MTPEGEVKKFIKKFLVEHHVYYYMPVPNGYGAPSVDFHCAWKGMAFFIEAKAPGKDLTPRQNTFFDTVKEYGCPAFKVSSPGDLLEIQVWMETVEARALLVASAASIGQ